MNWLIDLITKESIGQSIAILGLVGVVGLCLGNLKIKGIGLGVAGVLFAGLIFAHFGIKIQHEAMDFAREFGLILFVYTIGIQVGPGFFNSFKKQGIGLNLMSGAIVLLGVGIALASVKWGGIAMPAAVGIFAGATTNTPSLGAAQQALQTLPPGIPGVNGLPGLGYAVAYPFGVIGIIASMLLVRFFFKIRMIDEEDLFREKQAQDHPKVMAFNLVVTNPGLAGVRLGNVPGIQDAGIVVSRIEQEGVTHLADDGVVLNLGNTLTVVGAQRDIERLKVIVGGESKLDLRETTTALEVQPIILTNKEMVGRSVADLDLENRFGVRFTRINRAEVEFPDPRDLRLLAGDVLVAVGGPGSLKKVSAILGNSVKDLNQTQVVSVFIGIVLGTILGSIPFPVPGMPAPLKLGLAGGPLLVAILLSYWGRIGPFVWHMPQNANILLREIGIVLFLACVGLKAGGNFVETILEGEGLYWMVWGAVITLVPLLLVGFAGRKIFRINYLTLSGVLAGSMTDPPALAFANAATVTEAPALSYSTVYPLSMLLRVMAAQILVLMGS